MTLVPIAPPTGFYRNGINYSAKGRWKEGNLVRFFEGKPRAIGGWARRIDDSNDPIAALISDPSTEAARGAFSWRDNNGGRHIVVGTTTHLYELSSTGTITDITPSVGFTAGAKDGSLLSGYGVGSYGSGPFGTPRTGAGLISDPVGQWRFDAWGEDLLGASPLGADTSLFVWSPGDLSATVVANAPTGFQDFLVTDERIVMCIGTGLNGRGVDWSDSEDNTNWTPATTNQAGGETLRGAGVLLAGTVMTNGQIFIVGEQDAQLCQYLGPPYVYGFSQVGTQCGVHCANALVAGSDGVPHWFGKNGFFRYDGSVKLLPCEVWDFLQGDIAPDSVSKIYGFTVSKFQEIWWLYQSDASETGEVDSYVALNTVTGDWVTGRIDRTAAIDKGITRDPVMISSDGYVYNHELVGVATGDDTPYIRSGPIESQFGEQVIDIDYVIPAVTDLNSVALYLHCRDYPNGNTRTLGPYTLSYPTPTYGHGREIEVEYQLLTAGVVLGDFRANINPGDGW